MAEKKMLITLLTDFGLHDHFVGTMKGVIWSINPEAEIVDLCHEVTRHDIAQAAFLLKSAYSYFPPATIHVVVVDPGVGTKRRSLLVSNEAGRFIAPDNGVLSYVYAEQPAGEVREITADHYFHKPRTGTFDGRDVFAPVAAWLSKGVAPTSFGDMIDDYKRFELPQPTLLSSGAWRCKILYVDHFGNLVTNLGRDQFREILDASDKRRFAIRVGEHTISKISQAYADGEPGELLAIFGSANFLEFSVNQGNASEVARVGVGQDVLLKVV